MAFDRSETEMRHMGAFREHYPTHCELGEQLLRLVDEGIASVAKQRQSGSRPLPPHPFALHSYSRRDTRRYGVSSAFASVAARARPFSFVPCSIF